METRRDVFQAIADPTRREIIDLIAYQPLNIKAIAENFDITHQAVSLQIKILEECGLVSVKKQGRERYCEAKLHKLSEVNKWVKQYGEFWTEQFDSLEKYLAKEQVTLTKKKSMKKK